MKFGPTIRYISMARATTTALVIAGIAVAVSLSPFGRGLEDLLTGRLLFQARSAVGADPEISPRLKVFIVDDPTVSYIDRFDPTLTDWSLLLEALDARRPQAILIDKLFDSPYPDDEGRDFARRVGALRTPVHIGVFVADQAIKGRSEISLDRPQFQLSTYLTSSTPDAVKDLPWDIKGGHLYGARESTRDSFHLGHIYYGGDGRVSPFLRLNPKTAIPLIGIAAFAPRFDGRLLLGESTVPMTADGSLIANLPHPDRLMAKTYNMVALLKLARLRQPIAPVAEGDVVVILPSMYTGNTDWHTSAFGRTPGGFIHTAIVNSALTGAWLSEWRFEVAGPVVGAALGLALAMLTWGIGFLSSLVGVILVTVASMILSFSYGGVIIALMWPVVAMAGTALVVMFERTRAARLEQVTVAQDLATARLVQDTFLPRNAVRSEALQLASYYRSASACSGDWWTQFSVGERYHCIAIGDAVGHGTPAALVTAMAYATFMTVAEEIRARETPPQPDEVLSRFNRVLFEAVQANFFMSCFFAVIDVESGTLTYANAGHPFPILIAADPQDPRNPAPLFVGGPSLEQRRPIIRLRDPGGLLGMDSEVLLHRKTIDIKSGDRLVLFTDGMYECRSRNNVALGFKSFSAMIVKEAETNLQTMKQEVVTNVERFIGPSTPLEDDMTMVVIDYRPKAA